MPRNKVFINAFTSVCCAAEESEALFEAICSHRSGIGLYEQKALRKSVALGQFAREWELKAILELTCRNVLSQSDLADFKTTRLIVGSSVGGMKRSEELFVRDGHYGNIDPKLHAIDAVAYTLESLFQFQESLSFSTACTSSANALGYAYELISKGVCENVLVVGFDTLSQTTIRGFDALGVLSSRPCRPFDLQRSGMNVAEGIGVLLLQKEQKPHSLEMLGAGYSSDAHHMAQPSPQGEGALQAMKAALQCAGLRANQIAYINAHGTGTSANDSSEAAAIEALFGDRVFVSSTKSITGHTLGAAGALEAIICLLALQRQILPPNTALETPENTTLRYVYDAAPASLCYVMSNSLAFGGNNTSLIFGRVL
jgi:3-oxoacyl-[acyl-carrier-protein] synthase-1